jgi:hypothetical protein
MSDQYDETWTASAEELAALQELQAELAAQREQTAADRAATQEQLEALAGARGEVQAQTRGLEGDIGSFRAEQKLAADAAHTAAVELATAQGGDFYAPDVGQQVAPDGTITYDFDAHLHARGIDLDAVTGPGPDKQVRWLRASDGLARVAVYGAEGPAGAYAQVSVGASRTLVLLDELGQSGVPLLGGSYKTFVGQAAVVWPAAGGVDSNPVNVGAFTSQPVGALVTCNNFAGAGRLLTFDAIFGGAIVQIIGHASPAAPGGYGVYVTYLIWGS